MAGIETRSVNGAVLEREARDISDKVAQQVSEILEESADWEKSPQPVLAYRVPSPGVRYYF